MHFFSVCALALPNPFSLEKHKFSQENTQERECGKERESLCPKSKLSESKRILKEHL